MGFVLVVCHGFGLDDLDEGRMGMNEVMSMLYALE